MATLSAVDGGGGSIPGHGSELARDGGQVVAYVSARMTLKEVVKALEGSNPFYQIRVVGKLYEAARFVVVPLGNEEDDFTSLEATGSTSTTKDGAEEAAANALILEAQRDFGVVVQDFNFNALEMLRKENDYLRKINMALRTGWNQSIDHVETLQKACEEICMDSINSCPFCPCNSIGSLAYGAAVWAVENVWMATANLMEIPAGDVGDNSR